MGINARQLKKRYALTIHDLHDKVGMNVCTIDNPPLECGSYEWMGQEQQVNNLLLREFELPLRLNNTFIDILIALYGEDADGWIGHKIGLYIGAVTLKGKTESGILMDIRSYDQANPALAARSAKSMEPIPDVNMKRFQEHCQAKKKTWDDFLFWVKKIHPDARGDVFGRELNEIPRCVAPLMKVFLDEISAPARLTEPEMSDAKEPPANPHPEVLDRPRQTTPAPIRNPMPRGGDYQGAPDDDIPF